MRIVPGANPSAPIDSDEARRPTGSEVETRRCAFSISEGEASPVGSCETELIGCPQAEQKRPPSGISAEQDGHFIGGWSRGDATPAGSARRGGEGERVRPGGAGVVHAVDRLRREAVRRQPAGEEAVHGLAAGRRERLTLLVVEEVALKEE